MSPSSPLQMTTVTFQINNIGLGTNTQNQQLVLANIPAKYLCFQVGPRLYVIADPVSGLILTAQPDMNNPAMFFTEWSPNNTTYRQYFQFDATTGANPQHIYCGKKDDPNGEYVLSTAGGSVSPNTIVYNWAYQDVYWQKFTVTVTTTSLPNPAPAISYEAPQLPNWASKPLPPGPSESTDIAWISQAYIPYFLLPDSADPVKNSSWQVQNSPFYVVAQGLCYNFLADFYRYDSGGADQSGSITLTVEDGFSTEQMTSFSQETGVSITADGGVSFANISLSISTTFSRQWNWGYSFTRTISHRRQVEIALNYQTNQVAAIWGLTRCFSLQRIEQAGPIELASWTVPDEGIIVLRQAISSPPPTI